MAESFAKVDTYLVTYQCGICGQGELRPGNTVLTCSPPLYPHRCTVCKNTENLDRRYPYVAYKEPSGYGMVTV